MTAAIRKQDEIRHILEMACARRDLLILATPYLRFESSFLAVRGSELCVLATMGREDALYGLRNQDLKIRFPQGLGFLEGAVRLKGVDLVEGRRAIRLSMPSRLDERDQRVAYRVEQVGRVLVTFTNRRQNLLTGNLVDLSITGARIHATRDIQAEDLEIGDTLMLSVPLEDDLRFDTRAKVRHLAVRTLGVAFDPPLPDGVLQPLSRWVFLHREEARERMARRMELAATPPPAAPDLPERSLILVSGDEELEAPLREALQPLLPLVRISPSAQALKEAMRAQPELVIFHAATLGLDERKRLRTLAEAVHGKAPILLLGTRMDGADLFELAGEFRAASALTWQEGRGPFLERLVRGIIRRHKGLEDAPLAPMEA